MFLSKHGFCRCVSLTHGRMVPAVEDFTQRQQSMLQRDVTEYGTARRPLLTPQQLRDQIKVCSSDGGMAKTRDCLGMYVMKM